MYADDADFISTIYADHQYITVTLLIALERWNSYMNLGKVELTRLQKSTVYTIKTKKLGSKMSDIEEIQWRINKATDAYRRMKSSTPHTSQAPKNS